MVLREIEEFWNREQEFRDLGFLHRRGYLLYGPAGGGKSCLVQQIIAGVVAQGGIVLLATVHPSQIDSALSIFRQVEPHRCLMCVLEDIDALIEQYGESQWLSLLDGESQVDHVLNVATTNYPEKLDRRVVARPRRFDRLLKIGNPTAPVREVFLRAKLPSSINGQLEEWVRATEGFSFAACAELVISVCCLGNSFETAAEQLRQLQKKKASSAEFDRMDIGYTTSGGLSCR
jgi:SpoVK/Ycf46/Vps4 family AAA+-type ATPase